MSYMRLVHIHQEQELTSTVILLQYAAHALSGSALRKTRMLTLPVCFGLLMSELALFSTIVCPMPFALRKKWVLMSFATRELTQQDVSLSQREPGRELLYHSVPSIAADGIDCQDPIRRKLMPSTGY